MRPRVVVMLVLLAACLAGLTAWLLRAPAPAPAPKVAEATPFATTDVMGVQELRVQSPRLEGVLRVREDASSPAWLASSGNGPAVPIADARVRGLLRLLDLAKRQPVQPRHSGDEFGGSAITLVAREGQSHTLRFSSTSFAGERLMLEEDATGSTPGWVRRVESHVAEACEAFALTKEAPIVPWSGAVVAIDRIRLPLASVPGEAALLTRRGDDWTLIEPVQARVDAAKLLGVMRLLTSSVAYDAAASVPPPESSQVILEVRGSLPSADSTRAGGITITLRATTSTQTLDMLRAVCTATHDSGRTAWGPYTVQLPAGFWADLPTDVDALLSRRASAVDAADVAVVAVARDADAWMRPTKLSPWEAAPPDALQVTMHGQEALNDADAAAIRALRDALLRDVGTPTTKIASLELRTDAPGWRVELRTASGSPLDALALQETTSGGLAARSADVAWVFTPQESQEIIRVLRALPRP